MGYYKTIDGVKYDGELIELADKLTCVQEMDVFLKLTLQNC